MNNIQEYIGVLEDGCEETGGQKNNGESGKESFSEETDFKKQTDVRSLGAYGGFEEPTNAQDEQTGSSFEDIQDLDVKKPDIEICEQRPEFSTSITTIVPHKVTPVLPGVNNASASQNVLQIEETKQLDELNDVCGGDWQYLALLMPTADKKEMLGLDDKNAKQVTITYIVQDMIQRKQSFTVIMKDLIDRIRRIVSKEVHWACLIVRLKQTETLKLDDLTKLLEVVGDFETLWALLSMPCHTQENIGRNENEVRFPDMNELLKQLDIIVRKLEENGNLPTEDREKNKLCALLLPEFEPLLEIALSLGGKGLKQKFKRLSRMEKDKERFNIYLTSMGMEMIESKEILLVDRPHSECLFETHYIENCKMVGMPINRHGWGAGTLGFPIVRKGSNNAYAITSSHVMLIGEDVDLPTNSSRSIKIEHRLCWFRKCQLHCYQSDIEIGFVVFGYCELGNREKTGVEVVVLQMVEKRQHITENYIQYKNLQNLLISNWVFLELPRTLKFEGRIIRQSQMKECTEVYKIGGKTGLTKGKLVSKEYGVEFSHPYDSSTKKMELHKQNQVLWDDDSGPFAKPGDSGAPVFMLDKDSGHMFLFGIVTGSKPQEELSCVTPVWAIMEGIGDENSVDSFKISLKKVKAFE